MTSTTTRARRLAAGGAAAAALLAATAGTAVAVDTEVSFTVAANGAGLSVAQAGTTATIDDSGSNPVFDVVSSGSVSGDLPELTVTDQRGTLAGAWTVQAVGEAWANTADGAVTVPASNGRVYMDHATLGALTTALGAALDGMLLTGGELNVGTSDLGTAYTLLSGTTTLGNGSVDVTPRIDVTVPAETPVGTYTATVTLTVS